MAAELPDWEWRGDEDLTVGVEEEFMLVERSGWVLADKAEYIRANAPVSIARTLTSETHASSLEIKTLPANDAVTILEDLLEQRRNVQRYLGSLGLAAFSSGMHPFEDWQNARVTNEPRHQEVFKSLRGVAQYGPTCALHVHVGVEDPDKATRLLNSLRYHLPVLMGLSANSPYSVGNKTGFASNRFLVLRNYSRSGIPPEFDNYKDYVSRVQALIDGGKIKDPSNIWWFIRLQPKHGTVEVRIMDAQLKAVHSAALAAYIQLISSLELDKKIDFYQPIEIIEENLYEAAQQETMARPMGLGLSDYAGGASLLKQIEEAVLEGEKGVVKPTSGSRIPLQLIVSLIRLHSQRYLQTLENVANTEIMISELASDVKWHKSDVNKFIKLSQSWSLIKNITSYRGALQQETFIARNHAEGDLGKLVEHMVQLYTED